MSGIYQKRGGRLCPLDMAAMAPYELCEFYYFRHPELRPGFEELAGAVIEGAAEIYPEAWAYLQTAEGQKLCKTGAEWQELSTKSYYALADGTEIGFNGIGGVPFYAPDLGAGSLRMPDIRGMYPEAAGFDSLAVGGVGIDRARNIRGRAPYISSWADTEAASGAFWWAQNRARATGITNAMSYDSLNFDASKAAPVGAANAPRHFGVLACAWLGKPAAREVQKHNTKT